MTKLILITLALTALAACVNGHGRMIFPINRASAWRERRPGFPKNIADTQWCGVKKDGVLLENERNVTCGIAGPIYNGKIQGASKVFLPEFGKAFDLYSFEYGSEMYRGTIVETFKSGQVVDAKVRVGGNHPGWIEFRLCEAPEDADPTMECFENNKLHFTVDNSTRVELNSVDIIDFVHTYPVKLPEGLTCEHCVFQMYWWSRTTKQQYFGKLNVILNLEFYKLVFFFYINFFYQRCC